PRALRLRERKAPFDRPGQARRIGAPHYSRRWLGVLRRRQSDRAAYVVRDHPAAPRDHPSSRRGGRNDRLTVQELTEVLVVEDDRATREMIVAALAEAGYVVVAARERAAGLYRCRQVGSGAV